MGRYFKSYKELVNLRGEYPRIKECANIHVSGSVRGMRKLYWGYDCDVVRIGKWVYRVPNNQYGTL